LLLTLAMVLVAMVLLWVVLSPLVASGRGQPCFVASKLVAKRNAMERV
jgi:hypothetical protein